MIYQITEAVVTLWLTVWILSTLGGKSMFLNALKSGMGFGQNAMRIVGTLLAYLLGVVVGLIVMSAKQLNFGLEAFVVGLVIWPLWNVCAAVASPYMASPIGYLQAVGLYALFRIFWGNIFTTTGEVLSHEEKALVRLYRTSLPQKGSPGDGARRSDAECERRHCTPTGTKRPVPEAPKG